MEAGKPTGRAQSVPESWVDEHGDALYRYALSRLQNPSTVEDAVQEDFCQAMGIPSRYKCQSEGGPSLAQCFDLLRKASSRPAPEMPGVG